MGRVPFQKENRMKTMQQKYTERLEALLRNDELPALELVDAGGPASNVRDLHIVDEESEATVMVVRWQFQRSYCSVDLGGPLLDELRNAHAPLEDPSPDQNYVLEIIEGHPLLRWFQLEFIETARVNLMFETIATLLEMGQEFA